jgi:hypothetical protein
MLERFPLKLTSWKWWDTPIIPFFEEAEIGGWTTVKKN